MSIIHDNIEEGTGDGVVGLNPEFFGLNQTFETHLGHSIQGLVSQVDGSNGVWLDVTTGREVDWEQRGRYGGA